MIISYCLNPSCPKPQNDPKEKVCQTCGSSLILRNRYRGIKQIGEGGFGSTFLAVDLLLPGNPFCVIKQLLPSADNQETFQMAFDLFYREAKTLGKIDHPQIPKLLDFFEDKQQFYLVQSLIKGRNLRQEVRKNGVFSEMAIKSFLAEMLPIIKYIHSLKIIHRDIKPANIIRREQDGKLVLIDFGAVKDQVTSHLAKSQGQTGETAFTKFSIGTTGFAPPEQLLMRPVYSSDIYALGVTCLFLMTNKSPKKMSIDEFGQLLWKKEVKVSSSFAKVLEKMLEVDVRNRFQMVDQVIRALDIVPYEQQLQQSLIFNNSHDRQNFTQSIESDSTEVTHTSATVRLAKAIRARQSRQGKSKFVIDLTPQTLLVAYANGRRDFSNQCLNKLNLAKCNLSGSIFRNCQLVNINLERANLNNVNFYNSNLSGAILHKANLQETHFLKANLENADLRGADLKKANLTNSNLQGTNLCGANLKDAKVEDDQLKATKTNWSTIFPEGKRRLWD